MCFGTLNTISLLIFFISFFKKKRKEKNYKIDNYKIDFFIIIYDI
jgi:hypothetical protein